MATTKLSSIFGLTPDWINDIDRDINKRFAYCPLAALINKYGFTQDDIRDQSPKLASVNMNCRDAESIKKVQDSDVDLSIDIKRYYTTAMGMLSLKGVELSEWRQSMLRVLKNADRGLIEHEADWRILCRMVAFYAHDTAIDALTTQFSGVPTAYYNKVDHKTHTVRVKLTQWMKCPVKSGGSHKLYVFGHDSNNVLYKFCVYGNRTSYDLARIMAQSQMDVVAEFVQYTTRTSNGTCSEYMEVSDASISVVTH